jgi:antirestriction protein ArdC
MEETTMQKTERTERQDVYTRITAQIVADLEKGVRPWVKPWNAEQSGDEGLRCGFKRWL